MISVYLTHAPQQQSRNFLRHILSERYRIEAELCSSPAGKPCLSNNPLRFSLAHSGGLLALAVCKQEIGLDAELRRPIRCEAIAARLSQAERKEDFLTLWTAKEAYVKFRGERLCSLLPALRYEAGVLSFAGAPVSACLRHFEAEGAVLCVCTEHKEDVRLTVV